MDWIPASFLIASTSGGFSVTALPPPKLMPPLRWLLGRTLSTFVPILAVCSFVAWEAPCAMAIIVITAPTPMMIPSIVRKERSLLDASACSATLTSSQTGMPPLTASRGGAVPAVSLRSNVVILSLPRWVLGIGCWVLGGTGCSFPSQHPTPDTQHRGEQPMKIKWYGHACFRIEGRPTGSGGPTVAVVTDPYTPEVSGYDPIPEPADVVIMSSATDAFH